MEYIINGKHQLSGTVTVSGAKNAALKLIIASFLLEGKTTLHNVPRIRDIFALLEIVNFLGGSAKFVKQNTVEITNHLDKAEIPLEIAGRTRTSIMLLAPLLHQFKKAIVANPGGCRLGERSVDRLIASLKQMGATIEYKSTDGYYYASLEKAKPSLITFNKKSHTGTELAIMFASRIEGETMIENAALEPEINDLIAFLNLAGANIKREGENIIVQGQEKLQGVEFTVQSDRIEAVTFIVLSSLFNGQIKVKGVNLQAIEPFLKPYLAAGFKYDYEPTSRLFSPHVPETVQGTDVTTAPHPGFLTDWQPLWVLLMTQATGVSLVHETVFENRFSYVSDLKKFGAKVRFAKVEVENSESVYQFNNYDPLVHKFQAVKITGPSLLHNAYATMTDIRAGACLVIAALIAQGKSVVDGAEQIERGYEALVDKLTKLGAEITVHSNA